MSFQNIVKMKKIELDFQLLNRCQRFKQDTDKDELQRTGNRRTYYYSLC